MTDMVNERGVSLWGEHHNQWEVRALPYTPVDGR